MNEVPQRKIAPKPLVLKCFASYYLLECAVKTQMPNTRKKRKFFRTAKKRGKRPPKWHFWKNIKNRKIRKQPRKLDFRKLQKNHFALQKEWFHKAGAAKRRFGGRKVTHETRKRKPQMNSGAYIYIYICRKGTGLSTFWPF